MKITYIVHSTSTDNELGICSGWSDPELSPLGLRQAKSLVSYFYKYCFDAILVSDMTRAKQTAEIIFNNRPIIIEPRLREMNYGELNGKHIGYFNEYVGWEIGNKHPNGESCLDVQSRVNLLLIDLFKEYKNQSVAFVSHKYPQLALEVICNGLSWEKAIRQDWRKFGAWQPTWEYKFHG
jgi:broad specificity phosphatase PhoE